MKKRILISVNIGFITNSSSVVHHFPRKLLEHPKVAEFMRIYELSGGMIGDNLWHRGQCATIAMTTEQKQQVVRRLDEINDGETEFTYTCPAIDVESDDIVIIYGDEYTSVASELSHMLQQAAQEMGIGCGSGQDYN